MWAGRVYGYGLLNASTVDDSRAGTSTENAQADANAEILRVGSGSDPDGIARSCQRDGVPDALAGGRCRQAVVGIAPQVTPLRYQVVAARAFELRTSVNATSKPLCK